MAAAGAHSQHDHIPVSLRVGGKVTMPHTGHGVLRAQVTVGQNRIVRVADIRAKNVFAARYRHTVVRPGAALGDHQVVHPVLFVEVRAFGPDDIPQRTLPQGVALPRQAHGV